MIQMTPQYRTVLFCEVWDEYEAFKQSLNESLFKDSIEMKEENIKLTFALLFAKYGNNPIANSDINQFKNKIFSIMFQYGPTWEKKLHIQSELRKLNDEEILKGSKAIYNSALNPDSSPSTSSLEELARINSQNTTNYKKSRMDAYAQLWELLRSDVSGEYIQRFIICFKKFVSPEHPTLYYEEED